MTCAAPPNRTANTTMFFGVMSKLLSVTKEN
jgi:hypothetical protein